MPPVYNLSKSEEDYKHMQNMLFGNIPTFQEIMATMEKLETEING